MKPTIAAHHISSNWNLFLDRDGVINRRIMGAYVRNWGEFEFLPGVLPALKAFASRFQHIVVVTNQQGIYKQLMTKDGLAQVHRHMLDEVVTAGGRIDRVYFCPASTADDPTNCRKPRIGMAQQAQRDFPKIEFTRSIMVGDSITDLQFGRNAGMHTVWVRTEAVPHAPEDLYDLQVDSLSEFANWLNA